MERNVFLIILVIQPRHVQFVKMAINLLEDNVIYALSLNAYAVILDKFLSMENANLAWVIVINAVILMNVKFVQKDISTSWIKMGKKLGFAKSAMYLVQLVVEKRRVVSLAVSGIKVQTISVLNKIG